MIPNYRYFAAKFFNFKIIFRSAFLGTLLPPRYLLSLFLYHAKNTPVGNIRRPDDGVEYVAVAFTVRLWYCGYDKYLWIYPSAVINITSVPSDLNISATIQNPKGEVVPFSVSPSSRLIIVNYGWLNSW